MARTFQDDIAADVANTFLRDFPGDPITHYRLGNSADSEEVTAIVDLDEEDGGRMANAERNEDGKRIVHHGRLHMAATVTVDDRDTWSINGEMWSTVRVKSRDSAMQIVAIRRVTPDNTRRPRVGKLAQNE